MLIRHLIATDAADFRTIRLEGLRQQPEAFDEEVQFCVADFAARLKDSAILVGFDTAGIMRGLIGLTQGRMAKCRPIATIWAVHIRPSARGTGLAARLLDAAITEAFRHCRSIRLSVTADTLPAHRLYRRAGFTDWARERAALLVDDRFHDQILMRLDRD